jgi:NSS family neurotransmitter:Na+ symporter
VVTLDTLVAIIAAVIIFSAGVEDAKGEKLAFVAMPKVFSGMAGGGIWATLFFLLLALAAISSTISMHEAVTSYFVEKRGMSRKRGAWVVTGIALTLATVASLSLGDWSDFTIAGMNIFSLLDNFTAIIMLPLLGILTAIFVGWLWKKQDMKAELTAEGGIDKKTYPIVRFLLRYVCPVLVSIVFIFGVIDFFSPKEAESEASTTAVEAESEAEATQEPSNTVVVNNTFNNSPSGYRLRGAEELPPIQQNGEEIQLVDITVKE